MIEPFLGKLTRDIPDVSISDQLLGILFNYFSTNRNLWAAIRDTGIYDTVGFLMIFFGVYPGI